MGERRRYRKRAGEFVTAVRLELETEGFTYRKWGDVQRCKAGDWLVDNQGNVYTVDAEVFERTYREVSPGVYAKVTPVWAEVATEAGAIATQEGRSHYEAGDYLVWNREDGTDGYRIRPEKFETMYEPDD